jgi:hypothetical protein
MRPIREPHLAARSTDWGAFVFPKQDTATWPKDNDRHPSPAVNKRTGTEIAFVGFDERTHLSAKTHIGRG